MDFLSSLLMQRPGPSHQLRRPRGELLVASEYEAAALVVVFTHLPEVLYSRDLAVLGRYRRYYRVIDHYEQARKLSQRRVLGPPCGIVPALFKRRYLVVVPYLYAAAGLHELHEPLVQPHSVGVGYPGAPFNRDDNSVLPGVLAAHGPYPFLEIDG